MEVVTVGLSVRETLSNIYTCSKLAKNHDSEMQDFELVSYSILLATAFFAIELVMTVTFCYPSIKKYVNETDFYLHIFRGQSFHELFADVELGRRLFLLLVELAT